jgi:hypothetical protein
MFICNTCLYISSCFSEWTFGIWSPQPTYWYCRQILGCVRRHQVWCVQSYIDNICDINGRTLSLSQLLLIYTILMPLRSVTSHKLGKPTVEERLIALAELYDFVGAPDSPNHFNGGLTHTLTLNSLSLSHSALFHINSGNMIKITLPFHPPFVSPSLYLSLSGLFCVCVFFFFFLTGFSLRSCAAMLKCLRQTPPPFGVIMPSTYHHPATHNMHKQLHIQVHKYALIYPFFLFSCFSCVVSLFSKAHYITSITKKQCRLSCRGCLFLTCHCCVRSEQQCHHISFKNNK